MTSESPEVSRNEPATGRSPSELTSSEDIQRAVETTLAPNLQKLAAKDRRHVIEEVTTMVAMSGPLPPPDIARQFEEMCPGFVDRSLKMAEKAQQAEIDADSDERQKNQNYRFFGMACAVAITLSLIGAGVYIAVAVNVYAGVGAALITFVASAIVTFINGRPLSDGAQTDKATEPEPSKSKSKSSPKRKR